MKMTYEKAKEVFASAHSKSRGKPLENNTRLHFDEDTGDYCVVLHKTCIVRIHADGTYTLFAGGWTTVTTKDRINRYSPARIHSDKGLWVMSCNTGKKETATVLRKARTVVEYDYRAADKEHPDESFWKLTNEERAKYRTEKHFPAHEESWERDVYKTYVFEEGMKVDGNGVPIDGTLFNDSREKEVKAFLDREIRKYINDYADHFVKQGSLPTGFSGDCFGCQMRAGPATAKEEYFGYSIDKAQRPQDTDAMGVDHLLLHMGVLDHGDDRERYYVPSILRYGIEESGAKPGIWWFTIDSDLKNGRPRDAKGSIRRFVRKYMIRRKPLMVEYMVGHEVALTGWSAKDAQKEAAS